MRARRSSAPTPWLVLAFASLALILVLTACGSSNLKVRHRSTPDQVVVVKTGPPPHAPAHGYRHRHEGKVNMTYDAGLGVYVVIGARDCYFHDDHYLRLARSGWEMSLSFGGPWQPSPTKSLPPGLAKKYGHEPAGKKNKKK